jgi:hypothetical protein
MANFPFQAYMMLKVFTDDGNGMLVGKVLTETLATNFAQSNESSLRE